LIRVESRAFSSSSFDSIVIPRSVEFIDCSAFCGVQLSTFLIESGNETFVLENEFLIDRVRHGLIQAFSPWSHFEIPCDIEIVGSSSFTEFESISSIFFEPNSRLKRIESCAIPLDVVVIGIPSQVLFIAYDAAPNVSRLTLSAPDLYPEFDRWRQLRQSRIAFDFRRIQRSTSGVIDFRRYLVDFTVLEEGPILGQCQSISSQIYRRRSDCRVIVVKSIPLSNSIEQCQIENEVENLLNLIHPLIQAPIGFIFPVESSLS
jgi:hypothetical protein